MTDSQILKQSEQYFSVTARANRGIYNLPLIASRWEACADAILALPRPRNPIKEEEMRKLHEFACERWYMHRDDL